MTLSFSSLSGGTSFTVITSTGGSKTATLSKTFPAGTYLIESMAADTNLEIYLGASDGTQVGSCVAGAKSVTASASFLYVTTVNADTNDAVTFTLKSAATLATKTDAVWAPPTITDITPSGLPNVDDTTTITGTNFASNVEVKFRKSDNSTLVTPKTTVRGSATSIIAGRPDSFAVGDAPYDVIVTNPTTTLSATSLNAITSGAVPVWVTSTTLNTATLTEAFSQTIQATDADGSSTITYAIVSGSFQTGLSFNTSTGAITGTPTGSAGSTSVVISATDSGGNAVNRTFTQVINPAVLVVDYLVVAGGGGGGSGGAAGGDRSGGGGGAGGLRSTVTATGGGGSLETALTMEFNTPFTVTIGAGGAGGTAGGNAGTAGQDSVFSTITSTGGGGGGKGNSGNTGTTGGNGGSAGGGGATGTNTTSSPGTRTSSPVQGFGAGTGQVNAGGGGGGAGAAGANGQYEDIGGNGGNGVAVSITGSSVTYAGGGGGADSNGSSGGAGGGGSGVADNTVGTAGTANLGGGGGGSYNGGTGYAGGAGGSGIVVLRYASATQLASGGNTITTDGTYWYHKFTSSGVFNTTASYFSKARGGTVNTDGTYWYHTFTGSGTFTPTQSLTADILVVAGGGGSNNDSPGGGGAGGLLTFTSQSLTATNYTCTVGSGGAYATNGDNSQFGSLTACVGGGRGGGNAGAVGNGGSGGGGTGGGTITAGTGTSGQGNNGGAGYSAGSPYGGGGGGGAGAAGNAGRSTSDGAGGVGATSSLINAMGAATSTGQLSGGNYYYAGGGGGNGGLSTAGVGGLGGGGTGQSVGTTTSTNGTANTGGGAGGGNVTQARTGGSGIIIIRYAV
jgi:hypothetical protein